MIVNRTMPGGRLVRMRNIEAWSTSSAAVRPSLGVSISRLAAAGNGRMAGSSNSLAMPSISRGSVETPRETARSSTATVPMRMTGGTCRGKGRSGQEGSSHGGPISSTERRTAASSELTRCIPSRQRSPSACPFCVEASADLVLEASVLLVELHEVALGLGLDLRHPPPVRLDGRAHLVPGWSGCRPSAERKSR